MSKEVHIRFIEMLTKYEYDSNEYKHREAWMEFIKGFRREDKNEYGISLPMDVIKIIGGHVNKGYRPIKFTNDIDSTTTYDIKTMIDWHFTNIQLDGKNRLWLFDEEEYVFEDFIMAIRTQDCLKVMKIYMSDAKAVYKFLEIMKRYAKHPIQDLQATPGFARIIQIIEFCMVLSEYDCNHLDHPDKEIEGMTLLFAHCGWNTVVRAIVDVAYVALLSNPYIERLLRLYGISFPSDGKYPDKCYKYRRISQVLNALGTAEQPKAIKNYLIYMKVLYVDDWPDGRVINEIEHRNQFMKVIDLFGIRYKLENDRRKFYIVQHENNDSTIAAFHYLLLMIKYPPEYFDSHLSYQPNFEEFSYIDGQYPENRRYSWNPRGQHDAVDLNDIHLSVPYRFRFQLIYGEIVATAFGSLYQRYRSLAGYEDNEDVMDILFPTHIDNHTV